MLGKNKSSVNILHFVMRLAVYEWKCCTNVHFTGSILWYKLTAASSSSLLSALEKLSEEAGRA